jgi:hypothetical protein
VRTAVRCPQHSPPAAIQPPRRQAISRTRVATFDHLVGESRAGDISSFDVRQSSLERNSAAAVFDGNLGISGHITDIGLRYKLTKGGSPRFFKLADNILHSYVRLDERRKSWAVCKTTGGIAVNRPCCQSELIELRDNLAKV